MSAVNGGWDGPPIVKDGLVLYLDAGSPNSFYSPTAGTTWKDISGNANNGTLTNGPTYNSGNGGSIMFDGVDDYVTGSIATLSNFSLTYTVNSANISAQLIYYPAGLSFSGTAGGVFFGGNYAQYAPKTGIYDGTNDVISNVNIADNTWYIITATRSGTTGSIYINGSLSSSGTISSSNITAYVLGKRTDNFWSYNGRIAQTQIYNRALSASEVNQNFQATRARFGI